MRSALLDADPTIGEIALTTETDEELSFGAKIQAARKELGWSQARLAEHLGMVQATVSRAEGDEPRSTLVTRSLERFVADVASKTLTPDQPQDEAANTTAA
jgi:transcriptional regulator with XRE-family HTH domain